MNAVLHLISKQLLEIHVKVKHEEERYDCDECEYQANQPGILSIHKKTRHDGFKYIYNQCDSQHGNYYKL